MSRKPKTGMSALPNVKENQLKWATTQDAEATDFVCVCTTVNCYLLVRRPMTAVERYERLRTSSRPSGALRHRPDKTGTNKMTETATTIRNSDLTRAKMRQLACDNSGEDAILWSQKEVGYF